MSTKSSKVRYLRKNSNHQCGVKQPMLGRRVRYIGTIIVALTCVAHVASAREELTPLTRASTVTDPLEVMAAECGVPLDNLTALEACANRKIFKSEAKTYARILRLVSIGRLCQRLSEDDAQAILNASRSELEDARSTLPDQDQEWAKTWREAVVVGATQAADVRDAIREQGCDLFAKPGGDLTKIMTWSGKPQIVDGILLSPRTKP